MSNRRSPLGRGLGALITPSAADERAADERAPAATATPEPGPRRIPVGAIEPNPEQPRRVFDPDQLDQLTDSVRRYGVLQPVVVRAAGVDRQGQERFELVVGERRWRASQAAGLETIPAVVADLDADERLAVAIVENVQRHDLNPLELAHAFQALADAGSTQDQIGEAVGLDRSSVSNHIRLLDLPLDVQGDVEAGRIAMGHARALLQAKGPERIRHLRDRIVEEGLSVRAAEALVREVVGGSAAPAPRKPRPARDAGAGGEAPSDTPPELEPLAEVLRQHLQTRVQIRGKAERGRIEIDYFGAEDLERICEVIRSG